MNIEKKIGGSVMMLCLVSLLVISPVLAEGGEEYRIKLDYKTIQKGYTVSAFNESLKLSLAPGVLNDSTEVEIKRLDEEMSYPWKLKRISDVYQFEFLNKEAYDNHTPFYIQFSYEELNNDYKKVYFFDKNYSEWRPLPTKDYPREKFVRSLIHLPYARIAVFSYPEILTVGKASWYAHKSGMFTASPDYPKGSKLRIHNRENGKYVDVIVNDYGPDRSLFPDRAVDLEKNAFAKIASLGQGTVDVEVEPLNILNDNSGKVLGISASGIGAIPAPRVRAAIVMNENTDEVIMSENENKILPLASLTKLVSLKVFLDTEPDMDKELFYSIADEELNYQYCKPWESARLVLEEGDKMSVSDLFHAAIIGSKNNVIETLVRNSGMTRDEFVIKMNEQVKEWGAVSTQFFEPTGLDPQNVSTVTDYAKIVKEVMKNDLIQTTSVVSSYRVKVINTGEIITVRSTNKMLKAKEFNFTGTKTGYLDEALYCLMARVKNVKGEDITVVTFGAETRNLSFSETSELIKFALSK